MINMKVRNKPADVMDISENEVHIWLAEIEKEIGNLGYLSGLLSSDESERANRFVFEKDKKQYIVSHGILRLILSRYIGIEAKHINFASQKRGKPVLNHPEHSHYMFNLSHAHNYVIYAITRNREIGIDIEFMRTFSDIDAMADHFFSEKEVDEFFKIPEEMRKKAFFTCWTRKEAFIKAVGEGLYFPLDRFSVSLDPNGKTEIEIHDDTLVNRNWTLKDITINNANYVSAVVIEGNFSDIFFRQWN